MKTKTHRVDVPLTPEESAELDELAGLLGRNRADTVRAVVRERLWVERNLREHGEVRVFRMQADELVSAGGGVGAPMEPVHMVRPLNRPDTDDVRRLDVARAVLDLAERKTGVKTPLDD